MAPLPRSSMAEAAETLDEHTGAVVIGALYAAVVGHLFILPLAGERSDRSRRDVDDRAPVPGQLGVVERSSTSVPSWPTRACSSRCGSRSRSSGLDDAG